MSARPELSLEVLRKYMMEIEASDCQYPDVATALYVQLLIDGYVSSAQAEQSIRDALTPATDPTNPPALSE